MGLEKKFELTLKFVSNTSKQNSLIVLEKNNITLFSEEKVIYLCIDPKESLHKVSKNLEKAFKSIKYDIDIDMNSVLELYENKEEVFQVYLESIMFVKHKQWELKDKTDYKQYNILFDEMYKDIYETSVIKMEYLNFARDLQDMPPNLATSVDIAEMIVKKAKEVSNINIKVYGKKEAQDYGMGLFLSVNAGSYVDPRIVVLEYIGDPDEKRTALVGKGITFDSGGYNLKPARYLENMKYDMSGAAIASATVIALAKANAKCNVISVAMLTDNRIGGHATLPESVIKSMNGKTVEIADTDAEGRLVLADGMTYALREEKAERLVTIATLTGSIFSALGIWQTGVFATCNNFYTKFENASTKSKELIWRMPILDEHYEVLKYSKIADVANCELSTKEGAYSCTAAAFLKSFAEEKPYIHLDIAGTADLNGRGNAPMMNTLFELLKVKNK
ncbi:leucyl aminopeptidase [Spiroplasma helicoides]|uniref:Probable cytosol aminopeptidase n=1 Tax=Spiroplasma helicoides TaxID=216938 RepID=A0A1B3SM70_9MOLU|nr:M17 family metallopeptidase [Spiroplasma helicoides]AOG61026.1 leucyl aminopeptidase [Spiroplasma helicoides]